MKVYRPGLTAEQCRQEVDEILKKQGFDLTKDYFQRMRGGFGHYVGMATHDVGGGPQVLKPGMVFANEPLMFWPNENLGVRVEDTVLITETGCENLTAGIPRTVKDIEALMKKDGIPQRSRKPSSIESSAWAKYTYSVGRKKENNISVEQGGRSWIKSFQNCTDTYTKGSLDRREFFRKLAQLAGGTAAAAALLPLLDSGRRWPKSSPRTTPAFTTEYIKYPGEAGEMRAYLARPKGEAKLPGVIVIHENRGLNPHTEDVARRVALEGYMAIAPDALSPFGGTPANPRRSAAPVPEARPRRRTLRISWPRSST